MAEIRIVNTLDVETDIGKCFIQLCVGDITELPKEEKVDVLVLSAFPGDYSPTPSSLIGQLLKKLGVSVSQLAKDKEEDLRNLYSCWWSKPLPDHLSFRKILCFEGGGKPGRKAGQVVGDVFRCLVPVLANNEGKIIMPILASGDQGNSKTRMLRLLVNAAIHWMKTGLPLRSLKIVIFSRNIKNISQADQPLVKLFQDLKDNHEKEENQEYINKKKKMKEVEVESYSYDICLSYSEEDKKCVENVVNVLVKNKSDIRIFSSIQDLDVETSWQAQLYDVIKKCKRVMTLITPSFLQSARCTEQYNIALCLSRKTHESVLIPLYVFEVAYMPTYMKITQYIDCRFSFQENLNAACITIIGTLSCKPREVTTADGKDTSATPNLTSSNQSYDVFLSYSHCNSECAMQILKELRIKKPDLDVFIDTAELKAGGAWQLTLYNALERSKFVIALISKDYLHSKVCIEELCLSIVLQLQNNCKIWPLVIEPLEESIEWLDTLSPLNCYKGSGEERNISISLVCNEFLAALKGYPNESLPETTKETSLQLCLEEARSLFFEKEFVSLVNDAPADMALNKNLSTSTFRPKDTSCAVDIYIICSSEDDKSCILLQKIITSEMESLIVKISTDEHTSARLTYLDKARLVIPLLSSSFMQSSDLVHELNIAWCRQRDCSSLCFLVIALTQLPKNPTYASLFPCFFNCEDNLWTKPPESLKLFSAAKLTQVYQNCHCPLNVILCFLTAVFHIQKWFNGELCPVLGVHNKLLNFFQLKKCIQRYKLQMVPQDDEKEVENTVVVDSSTGSKRFTDELSEACGETTCKEQVDNSKRTEFEHIKKNEAHNPPQKVKIREERSNALVQKPQLLSKSPVEDKANEQGDTSNVLHGLRAIHHSTQDEIPTVKGKTDWNSQGLTTRNKPSPACKIV